MTSVRPEAVRARFTLECLCRHEAEEHLPMPVSMPIRYNLFRNREREDLCCAVPEDLIVPAFVELSRWQFAGRIQNEATPRGFDESAARNGAQLNGYYVFQEAR